MSSFKLYLVAPNGIYTLANYSQKSADCNTFNEKIELSMDDSSLTFSMLKYNYINGVKEENPLATYLLYGSKIKLELNNDNKSYVFNINKIAYTFSPNNLQITYTAIDSFQYELSKEGVGYSVSDDTDSIGYIGAQTIDAWAKKIIKDNNITWNYIGIEEANKSLLSRISDYDTNNADSTWNRTVSFTCSSSTAYAALKQLASDNEYYIDIDYSSHCFSFLPRKNPYFKGFYFNPLLNMQTFDLNGSSENLITVADVTGPEDQDGQEITLVPDLSPITNFINSDKWETSKFSTNLYKNLGYDVSDTFNYLTNNIPWLENKLIDISFFEDSDLISKTQLLDIKNILYNNLRIINGHLILATKTYLTTYEKNYTELTDLQSAIDSINAKLDGYIEDYCATNNPEISLVSGWQLDISDFHDNIPSNLVTTLKLGLVDFDDFADKYIGTLNTSYSTLVNYIYKFEQFALTAHTNTWTSNSVVFSADTNLEFYLKYNMYDDAPTEVVQECARIATSLSGYWTLAYNAACVLGIFLPSSWDYSSLSRSETGVPYLPSANSSFSPLRLTFCENNAYTLGGYYTLSNTTNKYENFNPIFLPNVASWIKTNVPYFSWKVTLNSKTEYQSSLYQLYSNLETNAESQKKIWTDGIHSYDVYHIPYYYGVYSQSSEYYNRLYCMPVQGYTDESYYDTNNYSWQTYANMLSTISGTSVNFSTSDDFYNILQGNCSSYNCAFNFQSQDDYYNYLNEHNQIWKNLYTDYPAIFREGNFSTNSVSDAKELYKSAKSYLDSVSNPEYTYSISVMDTHNITKNKTLSILLGDQIKIDMSEDIYGKNILNKAMKEPLYVTSISKDLRSDGDISLEVSVTKATDIMLTRFAKILNFGR